MRNFKENTDGGGSRERQIVVSEVEGIERERKGQFHCYFQGLAVISLTWQRDLDRGEQWIWPWGRVELWHGLE